jgi:hypothetical protein
MDGTNKVGEVRGNSPNQALNEEQQKLAEEFLQGSDFVGADKYLKQFANKQKAIELVKGNGTFTPKELIDNKVVDGDTVRSRAVRNLLDFSIVDGYSIRPDPSEKVKEFFEAQLQKAVEAAYENGYYIGHDVRVFDGDIKKISFGGKEYTPSLDSIKGAENLTVYGSSVPELTFPNLELVKELSVFGGRRGERAEVILPQLQNVQTIVSFNDTPDAAVVTLAPASVVGSVRGTEEFSYLTINNAVAVKEVLALGYGRNQIILTLPDTLYVQNPHSQI